MSIPMAHAQRRNPGGFTLIEMSVVLVVLGLVILLIFNLLPSFKRIEAAASSLRLVESVEQEVTGFVFTQGRLPWADTDGDGLENSGAVSGLLPWRTLGRSAPMRTAEGLDFQYAVYAAANALPLNDAEMPLLKERYQPTIAEGLPPVAEPRNLGNVNSLDTCRALFVGATLGSIDTSKLHAGDGIAAEHVAYLLVDPGIGDADGDGSVFDGRNVPTDGVPMGFDSPAAPSSRSYDDKVHVGRFSALWEQLNCSGTMSATGHAHPNVETTLALFRQTIRDYAEQLDILRDLTFADQFANGASIASAGAGLASASAVIPIGTASAINTAGATSGSVVLAGVAIGLNAAALGTATGLTVFSALNLAEIEDRQDELDDLIAALDLLYADVRANVRLNDQKALYEQ